MSTQRNKIQLKHFYNNDKNILDVLVSFWKKNLWTYFILVVLIIKNFLVWDSIVSYHKNYILARLEQ